MDETPPPSRAGPSQVGDVFRAFLVQGLTAFGGPVAHIGYFRREFVERRGWLSEGAFADLLALAQFLPGPASSQLGMAIGLRRAGYLGLIAAWVGFTLPAGVAMIALAYLAPRLAAGWGDGVLHGLQLAAAAVVLNALVAMARTLAVGPIRAGIAIGAAVGLILSPGPVPQILALIAGGLFGLALLREPGSTEPDDPATQKVPPAVSAGSLAVFVLLLGVLPFLAALLDSPSLGLASVFYRTGALVFGGGHVVLPLLKQAVVEPGWLSENDFLAGYGAAQAVPGPMFSVAAFLGARLDHGQGGALGAAISVAAIFLPGLLLVSGVLPFWNRLATHAGVARSMAGVNAAVVGLLAAALYDPLWTSAVHAPIDFGIALIGLLLLVVARAPALAVVAWCVAARLLGTAIGW